MKTMHTMKAHMHKVSLLVALSMTIPIRMLADDAYFETNCDSACRPNCESFEPVCEPVYQSYQLNDPSICSPTDQTFCQPMYEQNVCQSGGSWKYLLGGTLLGAAAGAIAGVAVCNNHHNHDGRIGPDGLPGINGLPGEQGPIGFQGPIGNQGIPGIQGPVGLQGPLGQQGAIGPQGGIGVQGPAGGFIIDGSFVLNFLAEFSTIPQELLGATATFYVSRPDGYTAYPTPLIINQGNIDNPNTFIMGFNNFPAMFGDYAIGMQFSQATSPVSPMGPITFSITATRDGSQTVISAVPVFTDNAQLQANITYVYYIPNTMP